MEAYVSVPVPVARTCAMPVDEDGNTPLPIRGPGVLRFRVLTPIDGSTIPCRSRDVRPAGGQIEARARAFPSSDEMQVSFKQPILHAAGSDLLLPHRPNDIVV